MGVLGELIVRLLGDNVKFDEAIDASDKKTDAFLKSVKKAGDDLAKVGKKMTTFITAPIVGLGVAMGKTAIDAEETRSKFAAVFKDQAADVQAWAEEYSDSVNRSSLENIAFLSTIQDTLVPLGTMRDRAADMSKQTVTLATDLASFNNLPTRQVIEDIQSAMVGNHETMRKYGVVINQATLDQELLNMGIEGGVKAATEAEKAQARLNLIMESTTDAQGDAIRTAGSWANQIQGIRSGLKDLAEEMGTLILPMVEGLRDRIKAAVQWFKDLDTTTKENIIRFAAAAAAIGPLVLIAGKLVTTIAAVANALRIARTAMIAFNAAVNANPILLAVTAIAALGAGIALLVRRIKKQREEQERANQAWEEQTRFAQELDPLYVDIAESSKERADDAERTAEAEKVTTEELEKQRRIRADEIGFDWIERYKKIIEDAESPLERVNRLIEEIATGFGWEEGNVGLLLQQQALETLMGRRQKLLDAARAQKKQDAEDNKRQREEEREARDRELQEEKDAKKKAKEDEKAEKEQAREEEAAADAALAARKKAIQLEIVSFTTSSVNTLAGIVNDYYDNRIERIEELRDTGVLSEKEAAGKIAAIKRNQAKLDKRMGIFNVAVDTARAIMRFLADPGGIAGAALSVAAGIMGGIQAAAIASQPLPAAQRGALVNATPGGRLVAVGEGGEQEGIFPLTPDVFRKFAESIVEQMHDMEARRFGMASTAAATISEQIASAPGGASPAGRPIVIYQRVELDGKELDAHITSSVTDRRIVIRTADLAD